MARSCALLAAALAWAGCGAAPGPLPSPATTGPAQSPAASASAVATPGAPTGSAPTSACPTPPWSLASLIEVPALPLDPAFWADAPIRRAGCFGHATVSFAALGGGAMNKLPGVMLPAGLGPSYLWFSISKAAPGSSDFVALLGPSPLRPTEQEALERTYNPEPGVGWGGGTWWRVAGHFDDPAASDCRSDGAWYLDSTVIEYTAAQAVEMCRELFVIESLEWLPAPPGSG